MEDRYEVGAENLVEGRSEGDSVGERRETQAGIKKAEMEMEKERQKEYRNKERKYRLENMMAMDTEEIQ